GVDLDAVSGWLEQGRGASPVDLSRGGFAARVGTPRLLRLFERFGITASWFIPGHSLESFPEQVGQVVRAGHEVGLHGYTHENLARLSPEQEEEILAYTIGLVERATGQRPRGYVAPSWELSPNTLSLLLKHGLRYDHSLMEHDFQPHYARLGDRWTDVDFSRPAGTWMKPFELGRETDLVEIPASWYLDDWPPMTFMPRSPNSHGFVSPRDVEQQWRDQFDWVYREYEYAIFPMTIHPDCSGHAQILLMHERLIEYLLGHVGVRFVTFEQIAEDFRRRSPRD